MPRNIAISDLKFSMNMKSPSDFAFYQHQKSAVKKLKTGSILRGGVGSGKTLTALLYYYTRVSGGRFVSLDDVDPPSKQIPLVIITTAKKRDTGDWKKESEIFKAKP